MVEAVVVPSCPPELLLLLPTEPLVPPTAEPPLLAPPAALLLFGSLIRLVGVVLAFFPRLLLLLFEVEVRGWKEVVLEGPLWWCWCA